MRSRVEKAERKRVARGAAVCCSPQTERRVSHGTVVKALPANDDIYSGSLSGNAPHKSDKYLWSDECMYEGEWTKGKVCDKGQFSCPSGTIYVSEFASGRMHDHDTFVGIDGDTYRGGWVSNKKNGFDEKHKGNDDVYEGFWRCN